jgi:hypothetical protein
VQFRSGACNVAIFGKEVDGEYGKSRVYNITFQRSYKDKKSNEWKHTQSFGKQHVANLQALLNRVSDYLFIDEDANEEKESEQDEDEDEDD